MTAASRQQVEPVSGEYWDRQSQQPNSPALIGPQDGRTPSGMGTGAAGGITSSLPTASASVPIPLPHLSATADGGRAEHEGDGGDGARRRPALGTTPTHLPQSRLCRGTSTPHTEADPGSPGRRDGGEVLPHGLDHSSPPHPEARTNSNPSIKQQPDGGRRFLQDCTLFINEPQSHQGPDGITRRKQNIQVTCTKVHTDR